LDFGFEGFVIVTGLRWMDATIESSDFPGDIKVDPLFARVGIAFRFDRASTTTD
jgi:hypothetical protein